jgi:hypothetical protein
MMKQFEFKIQTGDRNVGTAFVPDSRTTPCPVIIFCHGWPGTRHLEESGIDLRDNLISAGAALVTFDFLQVEKLEGVRPISVLGAGPPI